jgi:tRNA(Ile)-lysidine synthase
VTAIPEHADFSGLTAPVVVACSGGADSLALLVLAAARGLAPVAVHVDHGLRPGSAAEADVVREAAHRLGAGARATRVDVPAGGNLEARARDARYAALETERLAVGADTILVAHTADDQAETIVLQLLRGAGSTGLAGMARRRGRIVRPLLRVRRHELAAVCAAAGLDPVDDATNRDLAYRRAWVRHDALPRLAAGAQRDLVPVLTRQAEILRDESELLDALGTELLEVADPAAPRAQVLARAPVAIARRAVRAWLGAPPPSAAEVERVLAVARHERRAAELTGGRRVTRSSGRLALVAPGVRAGRADAGPRALPSLP